MHTSATGHLHRHGGCHGTYSLPTWEVYGNKWRGIGRILCDLPSWALRWNELELVHSLPCWHSIFDSGSRRSVGLFILSTREVRLFRGELRVHILSGRSFHARGRVERVRRLSSGQVSVFREGAKRGRLRCLWPGYVCRAGVGTLPGITLWDFRPSRIKCPQPLS